MELTHEMMDPIDSPSVRRLMSADPMITPSLRSAARLAPSAVDMPNPTRTGFLFAQFLTRVRNSSGVPFPALPVTPVVDTQ